MSDACFVVGSSACGVVSGSCVVASSFEEKGVSHFLQHLCIKRDDVVLRFEVTLILIPVVFLIHFKNSFTLTKTPGRLLNEKSFNNLTLENTQWRKGK